MAVVLLATCSCVQDTTEDLAPQISGSVNGSGEVKTLQVTLPNPTRTEMGDKVDGKYPVFWSESDVLAVNGEPTTKISIDEANKSVAVFDLPLGSTIPYNIVYPYPGKDVAVNSESGLYPVVFAASQLHTEGSFAQGAAPMCTWSDGFSDIQMHHLSTVLRFPIKAAAGSTVDLKYVSVSTIGAEPIAGVFDVYCGSLDENDEKRGALTAREGGSSTVFYNFENDHFNLDENGSVFYVTVPHGSYSGFEVNFVANSGEVCVRTFKASEEAVLLPGRVREFTEVEFSADSKMMLIGTDAELLSFAEMVKNGTFSTIYTGALLVADVDVTDKGLTTIDGFDAVFEGRHYSIKGLTQPLFGENVLGQIANLNVEGNIVETSSSKVGLIARSLASNGEKSGRVFNCTASGSIDYRNPNVTAAENYDLVNIGGVVGCVYGAEVSATTADVDVTISVAGPDGNAMYMPCIGGVVGYACALGEALPVISKNVSNGDIVWDDASTNTKVTPFIGGVAGYVAAGSFSDNVNGGALEVREPMFDLDWGGVVGASAVSVVRCENKGSMAINEQVTTANIGGVLGKLETGNSTQNAIIDCVNSGQVLLNDNFKIVTSANIGGVVAVTEKGTAAISECHNSGAITYLGECSTYAPTAEEGNTVLRMGGVVGCSWSAKIDNCSNKKTGVMDVRGKVSVNSPDYVSSEEMTGIGGVVGVSLGNKSKLGVAEDVVLENCQNEGNVNLVYDYCGKGIAASSACIGFFDSDKAIRCNNAGTMNAEISIALTGSQPTPTTGQVSMYLAGVLGFINSDSTIEQCENSGSIIFDNATLRSIYLSAVTSYVAGNVHMKSCKNSGDMIVGSKVNSWFVVAGGIAASTKYALNVSYEECSNSGNIEVKAAANMNASMSSVFVGGIFGESNRGVSRTGLSNTGSIVFSGETYTLCMGGYVGDYKDPNNNVSFINTESGIVNFTGRAHTEACVGGFAGKAALQEPGKFEVSNRGDVLASGYSQKLYISGGIASASLAGGNGIYSGLANYGEIEVPAPGETTEYPTTIHVGGVFGFINLASAYSTTEKSDKPAGRCIDNCINEGTIKYHALATDGAYIGGVVGKATATPIYNCHNFGKIISTGNAGDLVNRVAETADKNRIIQQLYDADMAVGGVVADTDSDVLASSNNAVIDYTCSPNPLKIDEWGTTTHSRFDIGGVVGRTYIPTSKTSQYSISLSGLSTSEEATIQITGSPYCTTNTSSLDWGSSTALQSNDIDDPDRTNLRPFFRMNLGGIVGRLHDHSNMNVRHYITGCTNNARISVPEATYAKNFNVAGILGDNLSSYTTISNTTNNGDVRLEKIGWGTSLATTVRHNAYFINMGGIVAFCCDYRLRSADYSGSLIKKTLTYNNCTNNGDLYYGEVAASMYPSAGGMLGQALHMLEGKSGWTYTTRLPFSNMTISMNGCRNTGDITYYTTAINSLTSYEAKSYAGGMIGSCGNSTSNYQSRFSAIDLLLTECVNEGSIQFDRSNGNMSPNTSVDHSYVGGLVGFYHGGIGQPAITYMNLNDRTVYTAYRCEITSCENHGRVWGFAGGFGGIVGRANWYLKITGTPDKPTINTADIVVARNESAGNAVRRTGYGSKAIYAGGIVGVAYEYYSDTQYLSQSTGTNEGWPAYPLGSQYVRIENSVNTGAVGGTSFAGGIAGVYRSLYAAALEIAPNANHRGGLENCTNTGDIYALEGATSNVGSIIGSERMVAITFDTGYTSNPEAELVGAKPWPRGVLNCVVGGTILRGANRYTTADAENYMNIIYGQNWSPDEFTSIVKGKEFDGCVPYSAGGEEGEEGEEPEVRR